MGAPDKKPSQIDVTKRRVVEAQHLLDQAMPRHRARTLFEAASRAIDAVSEAASGSCLATHATLYFGDFERPPIESRFDIEWGVLKLPEGWRDRSVADVYHEIERVSGVSVETLESAATQGVDLATSLCRSTLAATASVRASSRFTIEEAMVARLDAPTFGPTLEVAEQRLLRVPLASRDVAALAAGVRVPPHVRYRARLQVAFGRLETARSLLEDADSLLARAQSHVETASSASQPTPTVERKPRVPRTLAIGIAGVSVGTLLAAVFPQASGPFGFAIMLVLCLSSAFCGATIPGLLHFETKWVKATGAAAFFAVPWLVTPAAIKPLVFASREAPPPSEPRPANHSETSPTDSAPLPKVEVTLRGLHPAVRVSVDGEVTSKRTLYLTRGQHELHFERAGYPSIDKTTVLSDSTTTIDAPTWMGDAIEAETVTLDRSNNAWAVALDMNIYAWAMNPVIGGKRESGLRLKFVPTRRGAATLWLSVPENGFEALVVPDSPYAWLVRLEYLNGDTIPVGCKLEGFREQASTDDGLSRAVVKIERSR